MKLPTRPIPRARPSLRHSLLIGLQRSAESAREERGDFRSITVPTVLSTLYYQLPKCYALHSTLYRVSQSGITSFFTHARPRGGVGNASQSGGAHIAGMARGRVKLKTHTSAGFSQQNIHSISINTFSTNTSPRPRATRSWVGREGSARSVWARPNGTAIASPLAAPLRARRHAAPGSHAEYAGWHPPYHR